MLLCEPPLLVRLHALVTWYCCTPPALLLLLGRPELLRLLSKITVTVCKARAAASNHRFCVVESGSQQAPLCPALPTLAAVSICR